MSTSRNRSNRKSAHTTGSQNNGGTGMSGIVPAPTIGTVSAPTVLSGSGSKSGLCEFYARGQCRFGDRCKWRHEVVDASVSHPSSAPVANPETGSQDHVPRQKRCFAFDRKGCCAKGDRCPYVHVQGQLPRQNIMPQPDPAAIQIEELRRAREQQQAAEDAAREERERQNADRERKQRELLERQHADAKKRKIEADLRAKRRAEDTLALQQLRQRQALEKHQSDALVTIQRIQLGSTIVTFSAGAQVDLVVPGFETCRVTIGNVPMGVRMSQLLDFLQTACGLEHEKGKFCVASLRRWNQLQEGVIIADIDLGKVMVHRLNDIHFRGQALKLGIDERGGVSGMNAPRYGLSLKICWRPSGSRYSVTYSAEDSAAEKIRRFNGKEVYGRKVKVERDTASRLGYGVALLINGLPAGLLDEDVRSSFEALTVRRISCCDYDEESARQQLKEHIIARCPTPLEFEEPQRNAAADHTLFVRFERWELAKQVHDSLVNRKFYWIGYASFRLWLPDPIQYEITVPFHQYQAQIARWQTLLSDAREKQDLNMRIDEKPNKERVFVRVGGADTKAVGMLKVRIENLVAGEKLGLWHRSFSSDAGRAFLRSLLPLTGALVFPDWRLKIVKAYGEPSAIEQAREAILQEIERLAGLEYTVPLKRASVRFFAREGVASLKERFGDDNVSLNISVSPCLITIRGGEEAQHALHSLIEQSTHDVLPVGSLGEGDPGSSCPICLDEVSSPIQVGCGHRYCLGCITHFFTADVKSFPILCLGDEASCRKPIALPLIQKILTEVQFNSFLDSAFAEYIEKNPELYKYCHTPDCERLYRCASKETMVNHDDLQVCCPSCFSEICSSCHEDGHAGMTCEERRRAYNADALSAEWAGVAGVKRCPKCGIYIEKTAGCNHIECRCGAHICWRCMEIFDRHTIYLHMNDAHAGIGLEEGVFHDVDHGEQARALQNFNDMAAARRLQQQEPYYQLPNPFRHYVAPPRDPFHAAQDAERRRIAAQAEQQRRHQQLLQEQRVRDMEATQRRARQEQGGNWCTIM